MVVKAAVAVDVAVVVRVVVIGVVATAVLIEMLVGNDDYVFLILFCNNKND